MLKTLFNDYNAENEILKMSYLWLLYYIYNALFQI